MTEQVQGQQDDDDALVGVDAFGCTRSPDAWIVKRCSTCDEPYGPRADLPVTVIEGLLVRGFDTDGCALSAGFARSVALRRLVEDYGIGRCVVTDGQGRIVDAAIFARHCSEKWTWLEGQENPEAIREVIAQIAALGERASSPVDLSGIAAQVLQEQARAVRTANEPQAIVGSAEGD